MIFDSEFSVNLGESIEICDSIVTCFLLIEIVSLDRNSNLSSMSLIIFSVSMSFMLRKVCFLFKIVFRCLSCLSLSDTSFFALISFVFKLYETSFKFSFKRIKWAHESSTLVSRSIKLLENYLFQNKISFLRCFHYCQLLFQ